MTRPIITLLTDFGDGSDYPAQMKGVILGICPDVQLVDITHRIPPYDVTVGQLYLSDSVPAFPQRTVHLAVVDPGVGTARRPLAVSGGPRAPGHFFVGPDNGLLWPFARDGDVVELSDPKFRREHVSSTFHGRDVFAPAAAWLAKGVALSELGPRVEDAVRLVLPRVRSESGAVIGEILYADSFGNLISNIRVEDLPPSDTEKIRVAVGGRTIVGLSLVYGAKAPGEMLALIGSSGRLEVAIREGNARSVLGLEQPRGMPIVIEVVA